MGLEGEMLGRCAAAVASVGSGMPEIVLVAMGSSARLTTATQDRPVDAVIMAIVDSIEVLGGTVYRK